MFTGDQSNFQLAAHFRLRCSHEKNGIEQNVSAHDDQRAGKQRARNVPLRFFYFANDVARRVPAGIRIHHVNQGDRERRREDRHRVAAVRQKSNRLLYFDKKSGADKRGNQNEFQKRPQILEQATDAQIAEMNQRDHPNDGER